MNNGTCEIIPIYLGMVAIENAGIDKHDLQLIIITHGHSDHMGTSDKLREVTGAKTIRRKAFRKSLNYHQK